METVHVAPDPEQAPLQALNAYPLPALAVSVTEVPDENEWVHELAQLIPTGDEVTVPTPEMVRVSMVEEGAPPRGVLPLLLPPPLSPLSPPPQPLNVSAAISAIQLRLSRLFMSLFFAYRYVRCHPYP